jgi:hypothetical protein
MAGVKDFEWIDEHYIELQRRYPNMYIAVSNRKVLAAGKEFVKVYDEAVQKIGKDFVMDYIYSGEPFVLKTHL